MIKRMNMKIRSSTEGVKDMEIPTLKDKRERRDLLTMYRIRASVTFSNRSSNTSSLTELKPFKNYAKFPSIPTLLTI